MCHFQRAAVCKKVAGEQPLGFVELQRQHGHVPVCHVLRDVVVVGQIDDGAIRHGRMTKAERGRRGRRIRKKRGTSSTAPKNCSTRGPVARRRCSPRGHAEHRRITYLRFDAITRLKSRPNASIRWQIVCKQFICNATNLQTILSCH